MASPCGTLFEVLLADGCGGHGRAQPLHPSWRLRCWLAPSGMPLPALGLPCVVPAKSALPLRALGGLRGVFDGDCGFVGDYRVEALATTRHYCLRYGAPGRLCGFGLAILLVKAV